jgi:hypothetical protein
VRRQDYSEGSKASQAPPKTFLKPHQYDFSAMEAGLGSTLEEDKVWSVGKEEIVATLAAQKRHRSPKYKA